MRKRLDGSEKQILLREEEVRTVQARLNEAEEALKRAQGEGKAAASRVKELEASCRAMETAAQALEAEKAVLELKVKAAAGSDESNTTLSEVRKQADEVQRHAARHKEEDDWETKSNVSAKSGDSEMSTIGPESSGVGLRITDTAPYRVRGCLAGGAAHKTGEIRPGDVLLSVDGVQVGSLQIGEVRGMIVGRAGSQVEMVLQRSRGDDRKTFTVRMIRGSGAAGPATPAEVRPAPNARDQRAGRPAAAVRPEQSLPSAAFSAARNKEEDDWETKSAVSAVSALSGDSEMSSVGPDTAGVGLRITDVAPYRVRGCLAGGPAHRTGEIRPGDVLLSVDGVEVGGRAIGEVRRLIVGRSGSRVEMKFQRSRGDERRLLAVSMIRGPASAQAD